MEANKADWFHCGLMLIYYYQWNIDKASVVSKQCVTWEVRRKLRGQGTQKRQTWKRRETTNLVAQETSKTNGSAQLFDLAETALCVIRRKQSDICILNHLSHHWRIKTATSLQSACHSLCWKRKEISSVKRQVRKQPNGYVMSPVIMQVKTQISLHTNYIPSPWVKHATYFCNSILMFLLNWNMPLLPKAGKVILLSLPARS